VADRQRCHPIGAVHVEVGQHGGGHGGQGLLAIGVVVLPAGIVAQLLTFGDLPVAEVGEGLAFGGIGLAAVEGQLRHRDRPVTGLLGDPVGQTAGRHGLGLQGVADQPDHGPRTGGGRREHRVSLAGGQLGKLVHHQDGARWELIPIEGKAGHRQGRDAGLAELLHGLVGGRHSQDWPS
jgi:hypothetical protein